MAENVPPSGAGKAAAVTPADRPGIPYYEKLRRDLRDTIQKKRLLDRNMATLEEQIYRQETTYLEETSIAGNIVKGFDNYIKASAATSAAAMSGAGGSGTISGSAAGGGAGARRKAAISDADRVFSKSSVSYNRDSAGEASGGSSVSTPAHAGTPTGSVAGDHQERKKNKKKGAAAAVVADDDGAGETRSTKRQKISFSGARKGHDD